MKLNADYVRDILLFIEENIGYVDGVSELPSVHEKISKKKLLENHKFSNYDVKELTYAFEQLVTEGYLSTTEKIHFVEGNLMPVHVTGLTWKGHELLDNVRNNTVWASVKDRAKIIGGISLKNLAIASFELSKALMTDPEAINNFMQGTHNILKLLKL